MKEDNPHRLSTVDDCEIIEFPRLGDDTDGTLTVVENADGVRFPVRRVYYIYDVPADAERGGHSHHQMQSYVVALTGSFDVTLDDGVRTRRITLNRPYKALYIARGIWRTIDNFSGGAVCMALASEKYDEDDYVRSYDDFMALTACKRTKDTDK